MSSIFLLLQNVHKNVHVLSMKPSYSEPKIYTGGVDVNNWSKLSKKEQKLALEKDWYVYYKFRNPKTGRLVRQTNIKGGANFYKDKRTRYHLLKIMKQSLLVVLEEGFNPYKDNKSLAEYLLDRLDGKIDNEKKTPEKVATPKVEKEVAQKENFTNVKDGFALVMSLKEKVMTTNSFSKYKSRITRFYKWLGKNGIKDGGNITCITKKLVIQYLNEVLQESSPRNRNNTRTDLASFFQTLEDNDVIQDNFVRKINVLKAQPKRNKTYTPKQEEEIFKYLKENDSLLLLFVQFLCYSFLRPIEICRLKVGDVDVLDKKLYVKAKNQPVKIKIIPDILLQSIPDLSKFKKEDCLFTESQIGGAWDIDEANKRDYFTKRFKKVKDHFGLDINYGLYSFRHTYISKLYREMAKTATPSEVKNKLQLITGHSTIKALEQYLRDIDAALPEDYSKLLK